MSTRSLLLSFALALGCGAGAGVDAGVEPRDAQFSDGGGLLDAGSRDAGADGSPPPASCVTDPCDPRSADGCAVDRSCVLWSERASCEATSGSFVAGDRCSGVGDCAPGFACFLTPDGPVCGRICCPGEEPPTCTAGTTCAGAGVLADGTPTMWGRCMPPRSCDVLMPETTCERREGCYIVDRSGGTECRVAGTAGPGDACAVQEDCRPGFFCGGVGARRCVRICRLGAADCPEVEGRCTAQAHSPEGTGFCTVDATTAR